jgi:hypothetical protein
MGIKRLVEGNSRNNRLKRNRLVGVFFVTGVLLLAPTIVVAVLSTQWVTFPESGEYIDVYAEKLVDKPQYYVSLNNPDPYLLEALREPGKYVSFPSFDETQIDEQIGTNSTSYVEFEGSYYTKSTKVLYSSIIPLLTIEAHPYKFPSWCCGCCGELARQSSRVVAHPCNLPSGRPEIA